MNITVATLYLPYPHVPHGGGQDLFHLIRYLRSRGHTVRVVSFADAQQGKHADSLRPWVDDLQLVWPAVTLRQKWQNALAALRPGHWQQLGRRAVAEMRQTIARWPADVLHCAWTEMGRYLTAAPAGAIRVLDEVDVRFVVEEAAEGRRRKFVRRQQEELSYCATAELVLTRSARDLAVLHDWLPSMDGLVLPPVAHVRDFASITMDESKPGRVLFVGNLRRQRNQAAVEWLVWEVWPRLQALCPQAHLRLVGAEPSSAIEQLGQIPSITVTGWVPDLCAEYAQARVVVAPLHSEAGALNKVLDGLAAARPVVATSRANAGIGAPQEAIVLADSAELFAQAVADLLAEKSSWREIGQRGREFVLSHFDWDAAVERYEAKLQSLVERQGG